MIALIAVVLVETVWLAVLTAAWLRLRHEHDRLFRHTGRRLSQLAADVQRAQRTRHPRTGEQSAVTATQAAIPPLPVRYGRHARS